MQCINSPIPFFNKKINCCIYNIRGFNVMLDKDVADFFEVSLKIFKQAVVRNKERFPDEFMFQMTRPEFLCMANEHLLNRWPDLRYPPAAFTEKGILMLPSVLNSRKAMKIHCHLVNIQVSMRQWLQSENEFSFFLQKKSSELSEEDYYIEQMFHQLANFGRW